MVRRGCRRFVFGADSSPDAHTTHERHRRRLERLRPSLDASSDRTGHDLPRILLLARAACPCQQLWLSLLLSVQLMS
uniref:Uncharacterized protein n=1 Tax=Leersia perrieri TaxID=77586 RepID=A0A0D9X3J1_9ORYZ